MWANTKSPCANLKFLTVFGGLQSYRDALESEDYSTAASLRDQGAAGLPGWWVADSADDPRGHLLRISVGFGRYVGYAYTPQDLAQAEVGFCCVYIGIGCYACAVEHVMVCDLFLTSLWLSLTLVFGTWVAQQAGRYSHKDAQHVQHDHLV